MYISSTLVCNSITRRKLFSFIFLHGIRAYKTLAPKFFFFWQQLLLPAALLPATQKFFFSGKSCFFQQSRNLFFSGKSCFFQQSSFLSFSASSSSPEFLFFATSGSLVFSTVFSDSAVFSNYSILNHHVQTIFR